MQMGHGFARVRTVVEYEPVAALFEPKLFRNLSGFEHQVSEDFVILGPGFGDARNGFPGNDQNVGRRLRLDVPEGTDQIVLINNVCWNLTGDNFLEKCLAHGLCCSMHDE